MMSSKLRTAVLFAAALVCTTPACQQKSADENVPGGSATVLTIDEARLQSSIAERAAAAAESPAVTGKLEGLFESIAAAPEVAGAGEALMAKLGASEKLAGHFAQMQAAIAESPAVRDAMLELAKQNPGVGQEQLVVLFQARIEANTSSPAFDTGFAAPMDELMKQPEVVAVLMSFGARVASSSHLEDSINQIVEERTSDRELIAKLTKLNGGEAPSAGKTTDLLLEHVFTPERVEAFYVEVFSLPSTQAHAREVIGELLAAPAMAEHLITLVDKLLADEQFRADALAAFAALLKESPTEEDVSAAVRPLLMNPLTKQALVEFVESILADPTLEQVGDGVLKKIVDEPGVHDAVVVLIADW